MSIHVYISVGQSCPTTDLLGGWVVGISGILNASAFGVTIGSWAVRILGQVLFSHMCHLHLPWLC